MSASAYHRLSSPGYLQQRDPSYPVPQTICLDAQAEYIRIRLLSACPTKHSVVRKDVIRAKEAVVSVPIKSHLISKTPNNKKKILDGFPMSTRLGSANLFMKNLTV